MPDEETRDAYRIRLLEEAVKDIRRLVSTIASRQQSTEEWKERQEEQAKDDREEARRWRDQLRTALFLLAVSITSGIVIALISTGKI